MFLSRTRHRKYMKMSNGVSIGVSVRVWVSLAGDVGKLGQDWAGFSVASFASFQGRLVRAVFFGCGGNAQALRNEIHQPAIKGCTTWPQKAEKSLRCAHSSSKQVSSPERYRWYCKRAVQYYFSLHCITRHVSLELAANRSAFAQSKWSSFWFMLVKPRTCLQCWPNYSLQESWPQWCARASDTSQPLRRIC